MTFYCSQNALCLIIYFLLLDLSRCLLRNHLAPRFPAPYGCAIRNHSSFELVLSGLEHYNKPSDGFGLAQFQLRLTTLLELSRWQLGSGSNR